MSNPPPPCSGPSCQEGPEPAPSIWRAFGSFVPPSGNKIQFTGTYCDPCYQEVRTLMVRRTSYTLVAHCPADAPPGSPVKPW